MPSRKIISIFIISCALVFSIIMGFGNNRVSQKINNSLTKAGVLTKGPEINIPKNSSWQSDLSPLVLNKSTSTITANNTNLTEKVSESLFANYISLKQNGGLNNTSAQTLLTQALNYSEQGIVGQKYTTADIVVSPQNDADTIKKYGNELGNAFKVNRPATPKNEVLIFSESVQAKDPEKIKQLKEIALTYRRILNTSKNIRVPSAFSGMHIDLLNNLDRLATSVEDMSVVFDDPLRATRSLGTYQSGYIGLLNSISRIRISILKDHKVIYEQAESGYYLYYGI